MRAVREGRLTLRTRRGGRCEDVDHLSQCAYNGPMRILLFSGKGGVGKTSLAAATGVKLAGLKYRTLVMSIDPAHSLADSFDLENELFHAHTSDPLPINDHLSILELNIQKEIKRHWQEISSY